MGELGGGIVGADGNGCGCGCGCGYGGISLVCGARGWRWRGI